MFCQSLPASNMMSSLTPIPRLHVLRVGIVIGVQCGYTALAKMVVVGQGGRMGTTF